MAEITKGNGHTQSLQQPKRKRSKKPKDCRATRRDKGAKTLREMEKEDLDNRIFAEYMKRGGLEGGCDMTSVVCEFRPYASKEANRMYAWRVFNKPEVKERFRYKFSKRMNNSVLSVEERRQYLSDIIMQEIEDGSTLGDRLKCLFELNRMDGIGLSNSKISITQNSISLDEQRKMTKDKLDEILGLKDPNVIDVDVEEKEIKNEQCSE